MTIAKAGGDERSIEPEEIAAIVRLLESVREGEWDARLADDLPDTHPLRALHESVNGVIAALSSERERRARLQVEIEERLTTIELQQAALRELSTPIIEVWSGVLCLPIIGVMDSDRSAQMMDQLLSAVADKRAAHVIIDVTGVDIMDSRTLNHLVSMAKAVRLLGASCVITGIPPAVAQALVAMQFDTSSLATLRSLREALTRLLDRPAPP
jgi:rsbT co-antagonist protein RsbR